MIAARAVRFFGFGEWRQGAWERQGDCAYLLCYVLCADKARVRGSPLVV